MKKLLKIGIVQATRDPYNKNENTKNGILLIRKAKSLGIDIVLFPECWITGYEFPEIDRSIPLENAILTEEYINWSKSALNIQSHHLKSFCDIGKELSINIVITGYSQGVDGPRNSAFVIDRNGKIQMQYDKVHTCDFADEQYIESGNEFKVCELDGIKTGVMICYDREYPESARCLMLKGAEIILVPNDCRAMAPRLKALSTRAYENMTGVVMANTPGENGGNSCAYSPIVWDDEGIPIDNTIIEADATSEEIYIAEFDILELRNYRKKEMMGNTYRKIKAYGNLLDDIVQEPFLRKL